MTSNFEPAYQRPRNRRRPPFVRFAIACTVIFSAIGPLVSGSPLPVLAGGAVLAVLLFLLWQPDDLPILLLPIIYQWLQVAVKPILSVFYGLPINHVLDTGEGLQIAGDGAALFGFAGVGCLGLGLWLGAGRPRSNTEQALRLETQGWHGGLLLRLSVGAIVLGHVVALFAHFAGSAIQLVLPFAELANVGLFCFAYWCFVNKSGYRYLAAVAAVEIIMGFTGFFADFRAPVVVLAIAVLAAHPRVRPASIAALLCGAMVILGLASFWSEIKNEYRNFVSNGTGEQVVEQPLQARLSYIFEAASEFDGNQLADGFNKLLSRVSYIDFLAATMDYVPSVIPHEDGALIGAAILNMVEPRILFPNKPPLPNDTDVTTQYTGLDLGSAGNTSISIGYLGELYIDFGYSGALIAAGLIGFAVGSGYRVLRDYERAPRLISYGACCMMALPVLTFETALTKTINGAVLGFAAALVLQRFIAPRALKQFSRKSRQPVAGRADVASVGRAGRLR